MNLDGIILKARDMGCSDVHISAGEPVFFRQNGALVEAPYDFKAKEVEAMIEEVLDKRQLAAFADGDDLDFALVSSDGLRQRVNVFRQRGHIAATIRLLDDHIPTIEQLGLPSTLNELADRKRGLILVTGPTGSGKSTTLAAMIDYINRTRAEHIITIEDPIEYVYTHKSSLIHQREVGHDTKSFAASLRSALREDPDIILVGEMPDPHGRRVGTLCRDGGARGHRRRAQHGTRGQDLPARHHHAVKPRARHAHPQRRPHGKGPRRCHHRAKRARVQQRPQRAHGAAGVAYD